MPSDAGRRHIRSAQVVIAAALLTAALGARAPGAAGPVALKTTELGHGPTIVFVHSLGASRYDWLPTARKLFDRYHVVLVDLPGHGETPLFDSFSFSSAGEALDAVLAKENPDSVIVVGHALGGRVVLAALAAHPGRANGLVLIDVPLGSENARTSQQVERLLYSMEHRYDWLMASMFRNLGRDAAQSEAIWAVFSQTSSITMKAYLREMLNTDGNKDAKKVKVPVKFVFTDLVWRDGPTAGQAFKENYWDDTTAVALHIPNAAFWVMKDQPDSLAVIIGNFATASIAGKK